MIQALDSHTPIAEDVRMAVLTELVDLVCRFVMSNGTLTELAESFRHGALNPALIDSVVREELTDISGQRADE